MTITPICAWFDFWVGFFWDGRKRSLYFFPVPMLGLRFDFAPKLEDLFVRDPENFCRFFEPRKRGQRCVGPCSGDGHYPCKVCVNLTTETADPKLPE